jgi:hypothetical protein
MPSEAIIQALRKRANELSDAYMRNVGNPARQMVGGGVRGYFGLDAPEYADAMGMDAYRNAAAFSNVPGIGAPAGAVKAMAAAPLVAKALRAAPREEALETARKNAVKMLGLPENNTPMDRARALGFDTQGYRGSTAVETKHDKPVWWSEDPAYASAYAAHTVRPPKGQPDPYAGNVMPLLVKVGKDKTFEKFSAGGVPLDPFSGFNEGVETGLRRYAHNQFTGDMGGKVWEALTVPQNVRSRFAAFDPARVNEADMLGRADPKLLAALAAGTTTAATVSALRNKSEEEKKKKRDEK